MKLFTVAEMISAEKSADENGHSYASMMEQAGQGIAAAIRQHSNVVDKQILILVGPGNNGGDGLVAGRYLAEAGAHVTFYLLKPRSVDDDANMARVQAMQLPILFSASIQRNMALDDVLKKTDILIDALLGTGASRPITGKLAALLKQVATAVHVRRQQRRSADTPIALSQPKFQVANEASPLVVAVDCPSGLNCDSGALDPFAIAADLTVTFAGPKHGHFLFPGAAACGALVVVDIGLEPLWTDDVVAEVAQAAAVSSLLPKRPLDGHKGTFGTALVVGGCAHYLGAPILSATAAYRSGAGVVALAVPQQLRQLAATHLPEATYPLVPDADYLSAATVDSLEQRLDRSAALLVGPGLGENSAEFLTTLFARNSLPPLVIDADGLNYLAQQTRWWTTIPKNSILTPHPGEMSRLVGHDSRNENRILHAQQMAQQWRQIVVLKGAFTVIAAPDGQTTVIPLATPALAVAGSGDVLAGVIVGLLAQGLTPYDAALAGAYCHALAGVRCAQQNGLSGTLASEIAAELPAVMQQLRSG